MAKLLDNRVVGGNADVIPRTFDGATPGFVLKVASDGKRLEFGAPSGYTGSSGVPGPAGFAGSSGAPGGAGPAGFTGSQGEAGPAGGYTGSAGFVGSAGAPGTPGGYTGSQGGTGFTGSQGPQGTAGFTGSASSIAGGIPVYTGTDPNNKEFPVGSYLYATGAYPTGTGNNSQGTVLIGSTVFGAFYTWLNYDPGSGNPNKINGIWALRGGMTVMTGSDENGNPLYTTWGLVQRVF